MRSDLREQFILLMTRCSKMNLTSTPLCGLPINEMGILHMISNASGGDPKAGINLDMRSIQENLQISKPAISYNLNNLEKKEYIVREIDPRDRRRISIRITQKGKDAWELSTQQHKDLWDKIVEEFGESDMDELTRLLKRFCEVIDGLDKDNESG